MISSFDALVSFLSFILTPVTEKEKRLHQRFNGRETSNTYGILQIIHTHGQTWFLGTALVSIVTLAVLAQNPELLPIYYI